MQEFAYLLTQLRSSRHYHFTLQHKLKSLCMTKKATKSCQIDDFHAKQLAFLKWQPLKLPTAVETQA
jgi:hypothetical protein